MKYFSCDAKGGGTSAERARRVGRALGSNRFPFENHRRIRVACVRGTPGPRAARGIGIGHAPRPRRPPAFPAQRPRAAIEGARHPSTEASRTGPPWCGTPTPHADGAAAVHCGGELSSRADERAALRLFTCCARRPIPRPSNPTADAAAVQIPPTAAPRGWLCADTAASDGPREAATGGSVRVGENQI